MRCLLAVLLLLTPSSASALKISARLTASLHSWEIRDDEGTAVSYNTVHQLVSLDVAGLRAKGLSFHAYGRGFLHTEGHEIRRRLALYSTYADWTRITRRLDLRLGRQRISAGVGRGTLDGTRAVVSLPHSIKVLAYLGAISPEDRSTRVGSWGRGHACGSRISARARKTTVSLSFAEQSGSHSGAGLTGPDSREPEANARAVRLAGIEARTTYLTGTDVSGALEIDATGWEMVRARLSGRRQAAPGLKLSASVDMRRSVFDADTVSSAGDDDRSTEVEGGAIYSLGGSLELSGSYSLLRSADGGTHRVRLELTGGRSSISYYRRSGGGGNRDDVRAGGSIAILPLVSLRGSLSLSSYRLSQARRTREEAFEGVLALDFERARKLEATLEGRLIKNKTYDYDVQLFAKVTWWIDVRS
jgi:hypothetical protein